MRSEAVWLVQLIVCVCLLTGAFAVGWWAGRRKVDGDRVGWDSMPAVVEVARGVSRRDLFAPEVDLREQAGAAGRELTGG
ncbi:MAG: hypothetical protein V9E94_19815 [Microthrixaceae bacterium]